MSISIFHKFELPVKLFVELKGLFAGFNALLNTFPFKDIDSSKNKFVLPLNAVKVIFAFEVSITFILSIVKLVIPLLKNGLTAFRPSYIFN